MATILITGGTGYIGSHTAIELFNQEKYDVISIDNFQNSSSKTLERIKKISGREMLNYEVDICNKEALIQVFEKHDDIVGVIHFAALKSVGESVEQPLRYYNNNLQSLVNILDCCETYGIENFIFSSSCSVYGNIDKLPVTEDTPVAPAESPYANTKIIGEHIIRDFAKMSKHVKTIALRYFNPVGAHESGLNGEDPINRPNNLVPVITQTASGIIKQLTVFGGDYDTRDGSCIRDYIHVVDIALAHIQAMNYLIENRNTDTFELFNLGTGNGVSVLEAIKAFEKNTGQKLNYRVGERRAGDVVSIYSDSTKAKERLGWIPQRDINQMMDSAWKWQVYLNKVRLASENA